MSKIGVGTVIARAVTDADFRERLLEQPDEILGDFDLSMAEIEALKHLDKSVLSEFSEKLMAESWKKDII